jgi:diguanylate cyclase (GGDEF)-like protein
VPRAFSILLVDDDAASIKLLRRALAELGQLRFATSGPDALRLARAAVPDLVLLDVEMPGMDGFDVCRLMKAAPELHDVPIIFITSHDGMEQEVTGLTLGAADFISKPLRAALVVARVRTQLAMKAMSDALRQAAATDALTGIANRRQFDGVLLAEWRRAQRSDAPLSLLMIDVDHFKAYNDRDGHPSGDRCLAAIATAMRAATYRSSDLLARYGGEEFGLLLPETDSAGAWTVGQRLLHGIAALGLPHALSTVAEHVTVSVGITTCEDPGGAGDPAPDPYGAPPRSAADLVAAADHALYAAKRAGRGRARFVRIDRAATHPAVELSVADSVRALPPAGIESSHG